MMHHIRSDTRTHSPSATGCMEGYELGKGKYMDIVALSKALKHIGNETSGEMQLHTLRTLLAVAQAGDTGVPQTDLEAVLDMNGPTVSRNVAYWTKLRSDKKPGFDMIVREEDDADRRIRILKLNQRGKNFIEIVKMF